MPFYIHILCTECHNKFHVKLEKYSSIHTFHVKFYEAPRATRSKKRTVEPKIRQPGVGNVLGKIEF